MRLSRIFTATKNPLVLWSNCKPPWSPSGFSVTPRGDAARCSLQHFRGQLAAPPDTRETAQHLLHSFKALEQTRHLDRGGPAAGGDPAAPGSIDDRGPAALPRRHRQDDRLDPSQLGFVGQVAALLPHELAAPGHHPQDRVQGAQAAELAHLDDEVVEAEPTVPDSFLVPLGVLLAQLDAGPLDQGQDIAHPEDPPRHPLGVERLQVPRPLPDPAVPNLKPDGGTHREGGPAPSVAVALGAP